ncbi:MAG: 3-hydroxybutyryl-CoA dehydrogenase [Deltaproteobacteria bacterium]|nr:3-hydroxybutyryl-CoA dehydrogenase [Deltaproteobacteria bacterium]
MEIRTIGVIGAGQMGGGIAQVAAHLGGYNVIMNDISKEFVDKGMAALSKNLDRLVAKGTLSTGQKSQVIGRIVGSASLEDMAGADFVIEAATERVDIKKLLFEKLDKVCPAGVILASNTSSISITKIASFTQRPDRIIGMHFMNPVPVMKLLEIIRGLATSDETFKTTINLGANMGKIPQGCADAPGFVLNRLLIPMINEAVYLLNENVSSVEEIDAMMKLGANHPMGPLALGDLIGLDTCLAIMEVLCQGYADSKYRPCPLLKKYVDAGYLGRKSGRGFYRYDS